MYSAAGWPFNTARKSMFSTVSGFTDILDTADRRQHCTACFAWELQSQCRPNMLLDYTLVGPGPQQLCRRVFLPARTRSYCNDCFGGYAQCSSHCLEDVGRLVHCHTMILGIDLQALQHIHHGHSTSNGHSSLFSNMCILAYCTSLKQRRQTAAMTPREHDNL